MSVRRRCYETCDGRWLGLQWALRVLGDASLAVAIDGRRGGRGGGGRGGGGGTLPPCLSVFRRFGRRRGCRDGRDGRGGSRAAMRLERRGQSGRVDVVQLLLGVWRRGRR